MAVHAPDYFISYNQTDRTWAEWIAWQLEEAGFSRPLPEASYVGRLILIEGLLSSGHAAAVTRFELDDTPDGRSVVLDWEEPRVYVNVEPQQRRVEGMLTLGAASA